MQKKDSESKIMGMFDTIICFCPKCGEEHEFQSKGGDCALGVYFLHEAPNDVMADANRHSPNYCDCGASLEIDIKNRRVVIV